MKQLTAKEIKERMAYEEPWLTLQYRISEDHLADLRVARTNWLKYLIISLFGISMVLPWALTGNIWGLGALFIPFLLYLYSPAPRHAALRYVQRKLSLQRVTPAFLENETTLKAYSDFLVENRRSQDYYYDAKSFRGTVLGRISLGFKLQGKNMLVIDRNPITEQEDLKRLIAMARS
jgi:hypothetical protein